MSWPIISKYIYKWRFTQIASLLSNIFKSQTKSFNIDTFKHPHLSDDELFNGTRLGIDSWADSCCAGQHAFVESFVEGKFINATGFSDSLGQINNLPIATVLYAYDLDDGNTILLENNN